MSEEEQPAGEALPFPRTHFQFGPLDGGFAINVMLTNDLIITKVVDAQAEEQICDIMIQRRKERRERQRNELAVIRNIRQSKN
jgi:hypothetical protein